MTEKNDRTEKNIVDKINEFENLYEDKRNIHKVVTKDKLERQAQIVGLLQSLNANLDDYFCCEEKQNFAWTEKETRSRLLCYVLMFYLTSNLKQK